MYKKGAKGLLKHWDFILIEMLCLQAAFVLSCLIRNGFDINPYASDLYKSVAIVSELSCIVCMVFFGTMKNILKRTWLKGIRASAIQSAGVLLSASLFLFAVKSGSEYSRIALFLMSCIYFAMSSIMRLIWKRLLIERRRLTPEKMLLVTETATAKEAAERLKCSKTGCFVLCGIVCTDYENAPVDIDGIPVIAHSDKEINDYVCREWVDEIMFVYPTTAAVPQPLLNSLITTGVAVHLSIPEIATIGEKNIVEKIGGYTVITSSIKNVSAEQLFVKRAFDIFGGIIGCIFTGIIFIFLAPAIELQSPGKVFFVQERVGRNGKKFRMYKFRSMYSDAEKRKKELMSQNRVADGMMFKLDFDPRIIGCKQLPNGKVKKGLGNFIRDFSLDEFPQFFNVLKGDMSLVGTRPPTIDEWDKYDLHHRARMAIKPGITGLWQVSGRSEITSFEQVVKLDTEYIRSWSPALDIKILFRTIIAVISRKGSM